LQKWHANSSAARTSSAFSPWRLRLRQFERWSDSFADSMGLTVRQMLILIAARLTLATKIPR
jgi:hypothetical protein